MVCTLVSLISVPSEARELQILNIVNGSGVLLNWLPSANPNGNVTYYVQYSTDEGFTDGSIAEVNTGSDTTYYSLRGLQQGVRYYFRIRASNSAGSSQSNIVSHQFEIPIIGELNFKRMCWTYCIMGFS